MIASVGPAWRFSTCSRSGVSRFTFAFVSCCTLSFTFVFFLYLFPLNIVHLFLVRWFSWGKAPTALGKRRPWECFLPSPSGMPCACQPDCVLFFDLACTSQWFSVESQWSTSPLVQPLLALFGNVTHGVPIRWMPCTFHRRRCVVALLARKGYPNSIRYRPSCARHSPCSLECHRAMGVT